MLPNLLDMRHQAFVGQPSVHLVRGWCSVCRRVDQKAQDQDQGHAGCKSGLDQSKTHRWSLLKWQLSVKLEFNLYLNGRGKLGLRLYKIAVVYPLP
jgi:hypothetical protein